MTGRALAHYEIVEKLGEGGMGGVYKARDRRLNRFVALKILRPERVADISRKRRFVQEARAASALNHPNILTVYDIGEADGADFIAMEFVPGEALDQLIRRHRLPLKQAVQVGIQVAEALAAAHGAGIVHRDLKPGNIVIHENGSAKVVDFGLAKLTEPRGAGEFAHTETTVRLTETDAGIIVGTIAYMSPEQAEGKRVDARTDIFSFGSVLYEIITGRRAFAGDSVASVLSAILRDEPEPAAELTRGLPRELDRIITRCLQKDPNSRYQHAGDLAIDLQQVREELAGGRAVRQERMPGRLRAGRLLWIAASAACLGLLFAVWRQLHGPRVAELPVWNLTRLTADAGLSGFPALSPDGKLVAYSSDRGLDGELDLYIKQVAGGQPIRLTSDGAGNTTPNFSPDGSRIVFRSNRDGGGIYEIPAFGGDVRLLAREGLNPRFSPDGSQVAYWVGNEGVAPAVPGSGTVWVVSVAGGQPQRVGTNFTAARDPIWSPDGKHLLVVGYTSPRAYQQSSIDWWLVATDGREAMKTGAQAAFLQAGLHAIDPARESDFPIPACWSETTNTITFSILSGDAVNLWEIGMSPRTGTVNGSLRRLTTGTGKEMHASCASGGGLAFTDVETRTDVWSLSLDFDHKSPKGVLARLTQGPAIREYPSLSSNGRYVALASDQSGRRNIWIRDLVSGKESIVASSTLVQRFPVINASGTRIAYSVYEPDKRVVYMSAPGGPPEKLCEGCLRATDWSHDEKAVLVFGGDPYQINVLDLASRQQTPLLKHTRYNLLYGRFSPDNRWVSFTIRTEPNRGHIAIAPVDGPKPVPESSWITITQSEAQDWANWSPDGNTLYFTSGRDGRHCLWGQRLEPGTHRPGGDAFPVQHLHGRVSYRQGGWSAAGGRIAMVLAEDAGNVWMMSRSSAR